MVKFVDVAGIPLLLILLGGCTTTAYRPWNGKNTGYTSHKVGDGMYTVVFHGAQSMKQSEVKDLALLRAAEIALENGFSYFVVEKELFRKVLNLKKKDPPIKLRTHTAERNSSANARLPRTQPGYVGGSTVSPYYKSTTTTVHSPRVREPEMTLGIRLVSADAKVAPETSIISAPEIISRVKASYGIK